jgi:hypothetical protein
MADVGTVTGPDYGANQVRIVVYHNFEAASHLQKVSWLTEHCAGYLLPPSLWVRVCLLIVIDTQRRDKRGKEREGGGSQYTCTSTHTHTFYNFASSVKGSGCGPTMGSGAFCVN